MAQQNVTEFWVYGTDADTGGRVILDIVKLTAPMCEAQRMFQRYFPDYRREKVRIVAGYDHDPQDYRAAFFPWAQAA